MKEGFILLLLSFFSCNQPRIKVIDNYPDGQVKTEFRYRSKGDTTKYTVLVYFETGNVMYKTEVDSNKFVGEKLSYFENGPLKRIEKLRYPTPTDDSVYDCRIINYRPDGTKINEYEYVNNKLTGFAFEYAENGRLKKVTEYFRGIFKGYEIQFDDNGDTLKWFNNNNLGVNGVFYKKWLSNKAFLLGKYGDTLRRNVIWLWLDSNNRVVRTKVTMSVKGDYTAPE